MPRWHLVLPGRGTLLVSTDLHGNLADFERLAALFEAALCEDSAGAHWVQLGDVVHGPDDAARAEKPELYGYPDESLRIVEGLLAMQRAHPGRVHFVLGNHDHSHIGGPYTSKFHHDEVAYLEASASAAELAALRELLGEALLAVAAPCGLLLTHGVPDTSLERLEDLDALSLTGEGNDDRQEDVLRSLLTHYGQPDAIAAQVLAHVSRAGSNCASSSTATTGTGGAGSRTGSGACSPRARRRCRGRARGSRDPPAVRVSPGGTGACVRGCGVRVPPAAVHLYAGYDRRNS